MPTVAACQFDPIDLDATANASAIADRIRALPAATALAVFPEYALTGFIPDERVQEAAISLDGEALATVRQAARTTDTAVVVGLLAAGDPPTNELCYIDTEGTQTSYRKRELWGAEADLLAAGEEPVIVETPLGRTGLMTCYDLNVVAHSAAFTRERVDALAVAGAWPASHARNWELLVRARALDGVRWVIAAGRTGERTVAGVEKAEYAGQSRIVRPDGSVAAGANWRETDVIHDIDPDALTRERAFIPVLDRDE